MSSSMYSMRLAADQRVSAGVRFRAELEEQTKRRGSLSRRLGPVFAEAAMQANPQMAAIKVPAKAYKPTHGGYPG